MDRKEPTISPRLPQEIAERIIDCTTHGTSLRHLKTFSLVCSSWLPRSRFHLFRRIRIFISEVNPDALEDVLVTLRGNPPRRGGRLSKFLSAAAFVQELLVSDPFRTKAYPSIPMSAGTEAAVQGSALCRSEPLDVLNSIVNALPHLRVLELDMRVGWRTPIDGPRNALFSIKHLHRLVLSADASPRAILPLFSSVGHLTLTVPMNLVSLDDEPLDLDPELEFEYLSERDGRRRRGGEYPGHGASTERKQSKVRVERVVIPVRMLTAGYVRALRELSAIAAIQHLVVQGVRHAGTSFGMDDARKNILETFVHATHPESLTVGNLR
ncbi:hypothetical protein EIP86_000238 [Pleurotus ostreatoroseus]|nr:hypothetical protein EIP86_000238 [Pleurotus ostreatoroseus]